MEEMARTNMRSVLRFRSRTALLVFLKGGRVGQAPSRRHMAIAATVENITYLASADDTAPHHSRLPATRTYGCANCTPRTPHTFLAQEIDDASDDQDGDHDIGASDEQEEDSDELALESPANCKRKSAERKKAMATIARASAFKAVEDTKAKAVTEKK